MNDAPKETKFTELYKINAEEKNGPNNNLTYAYFPKKFTWIKTKNWRLKTLVPRSINSEVVVKLPMLETSHGDVFYLKLLLSQEKYKGTRSEE